MQQNVYNSSSCFLKCCSVYLAFSFSPQSNLIEVLRISNAMTWLHRIAIVKCANELIFPVQMNLINCNEPQPWKSLFLHFHASIITNHIKVVAKYFIILKETIIWITSNIVLKFLVNSFVNIFPSISQLNQRCSILLRSRYENRLLRQEKLKTHPNKNERSLISQ